MKLSLVCLCALLACAAADLPKPKKFSQLPRPLPIPVQPIPGPQPQPQPQPLPQPLPQPQPPRQSEMISAQEAAALLVELNANRAKWRQNGSQSYSVTQTISCFCPPEFRGPFDVVVAGGAITSVVFSPSSGLPNPPPNNINNNLLTVEGAFDRLEGFLKRKEGNRVARVTVTYDSALGYIKSFFVDINTLIADEEQSYTFENLKLAVPPKPPVKDNRLLELRINRAKWRAVRQSSYVYVLEVLCFCPANVRGPFTVTVAKGKVVSVVPDSADNSKIPSIEGLFDIIQRILDGTDKADEIKVTYDRVTGIPTTINIDFLKGAIDDERVYKAKLVKGGLPFKLPKFPKKTTKPFGQG